MFKSNCEGSHFPPWLSFFNTRDLQSWPTRQTVVQRAASAKRAPWPIAALAPNALPNGVLVHRSSRLAPTVCVFTLAPPVPSQVLTLLWREGRLLPLVVYETHCKDRAQVRGDTPRTGRAPLERANCTHARDSAARSLSCLGMCALPKFVPSAGWEGVGGRWPACAIPKPAIWADQCLGRRGVPPSQPQSHTNAMWHPSHTQSPLQLSPAPPAARTHTPSLRARWMPASTDVCPPCLACWNGPALPLLLPASMPVSPTTHPPALPRCRS